MNTKKADASGILMQVIVFLITVLTIALLFLPVLFPMIKAVFSYNETDEQAKELAKTVEEIISDKTLINGLIQYLALKNKDNVSILLFYSGLKGYNLRIRKENQNVYLILSKVAKPIRTYGLPPRRYYPVEKPIDLSCKGKCFLNITINKKGEIFLDKDSLRR